MNGRRLFACVSLVVLATGVFAFSRKSKGVSPNTVNNPMHIIETPRASAEVVRQGATAEKKPSVQTLAPDIPKEVVYGIMCRTVSHRNKKADELDKQGKDSAFLRKY